MVNILVPLANLSTDLMGNAQKISFMYWKPMDIPKQWFFVSHGKWNWHCPLPMVLCNYCKDLCCPFQSRKYIFTARNRAFNVSNFPLKSLFLVYIDIVLLLCMVLYWSWRGEKRWISPNIAQLNNDGFDCTCLLRKDSLTF